MSDTALRPAAAGPVLPSSGQLQPLGLAEVRITGGFWGEKQRVNRTAVLDHCRTWMERIGWIPNFDHAAHGDVAIERRGVEFVDSEVYKLLEAMAWELARRHDDELELEYRSLVARVVAAQEPDGYLHTAFGRPGQRDRYSDMEWGHELYCFGHLMQAAVARLRAGHDDALPAAARRLAEHVEREFGPDGRDAICGHPEIELGLAELGRATGDRRWIDLAALFVDRRGRRRLRTTLFQGSDYFLDDVPVREAAVLRGHAVRAVYLAAGAVDVAVETEDHDLLDAVKRQWTNTIARRTYITGGLGAHHQNEAIGGDFELPADRAYAETCAAIGSVMLSHRLLLATGEARYADLIERTLLNAVLVGPSEDGRAFYYANTLHQREVGEPVAGDGLSERAEAGVRAPWFEVSCCPTNIARTLASVAGYFATRDADGVQLHQYGDYEVDTVLEDGRRVHLRVRSEYPFDGRVEVEVLDDVEATLTLRVPAWAAQGATLEAGPSELVEGGRSIRRAFAAGDRLVLDLPMHVRAVRPDPRIDAVRGSVAFEQGPLVLSLESTDLPDGVDLNDVSLEVVETDEQGSPTAVLRSMAARDEAWPYAPRFPDTRGETIRANLRPYFRWGAAGPAAMRVWIPEAR